MSLYALNSAEMPWGDYGQMLVAGMSCHLERKNGLIQSERTGPFVPPISFPGISDIVVTDTFRHELESSEMTGFAFQPVIKQRIVRLGWEKWDRTAEDPAKYPAGYEPENYILGRKHSPQIAEAIGDLWELCLEDHAEAKRIKSSRGPFHLNVYLISSSWDGADWFHASGLGFIYVSERAKDWLETAVPEWVAIEPARLK